MHACVFACLTQQVKISPRPPRWQHPQVVIPAAALLEAARCTHDIQTFFVTYRFVQSQHAQHFANRRRSSSDFVVSASCEKGARN
jgi:hypothetical protein